MTNPSPFIRSKHSYTCTLEEHDNILSCSSKVHVYECLKRIQGLGLAGLGLHTRARVTDLGLGYGYTQNDKVAFIRFISYLQRNICRVLLRYMYMNV